MLAWMKLNLILQIIFETMYGMGKELVGQKVKYDLRGVDNIKTGCYFFAL